MYGYHTGLRVICGSLSAFTLSLGPWTGLGVVLLCEALGKTGRQHAIT